MEEGIELKKSGTHFIKLCMHQICTPKLFSPFPNDKSLDVSKLKAFADEKIKVAKMTISLFDRVENTWKRRKFWSPPFSPFPTVFSKAFFFKVIKSQDCVVKG